MSRADHVVVVEVAVGEGRGLADVVEQRREPDDRPRDRGRVDRAQRVVPQVLAGDLVLRHAALRRELRRDARRAGRSSAMSRSPTDGRGAASSCSSSAPIRSPDRCAASGACSPDRGERRRLDLEPERRREPDRAEHPQRVLRGTAAPGRRPRAGSAAAGRRARRTGRPARWRSPSGRAPPGDRVDGEVAAREVGLEVVAELDPVRPPEVGVVVLGPERRDLEHRAGRAGRRPSRTRFSYTAPGNSASIRPGSASVARSQSRRLAGRGARRAATRRRRTRHGRAAWRSSSTARTAAGTAPREPLDGGVRRGHRAGSVPAEEQVGPPGLVARRPRGTA